MPPYWLTVLAGVSLGAAFACAHVVLLDMCGRGYRERMTVMETVWPVTALYLGPLVLAGYWRFGRPQSRRWLAERHRDTAPDKPAWTTIAVGVSHCGAGCTLGDVIAEFVIFGLGLAIAGQALYAEMIGDYLAALTPGSGDPRRPRH